MTDLANLSIRRSAQRRITNNRDGVLPARRMDQAGDLRVLADMRNGYRADPETDALRRSLGLTPGAATAVAELDDARFREAERDAATAGAADGVAGEADPAKARSIAYQEAYYGVRAEHEFNRVAGEITTEVEKLAATGTPTELRGYLAERVTGYRDHVLATIPSKAAQAATGRRLLDLAGKLEIKASAALKERTDRETAEGIGGSFLVEVVGRFPPAPPPAPATLEPEGNPVVAFLRSRPAVVAAAPAPDSVAAEALAPAMAELIEARIGQGRAAGLAPEATREQLLGDLLALASDPKAPRPELLYAAAAATKADGKSPTWTPEQRLRLQNAAVAAENRAANIEREAKADRFEDLSRSWFAAAVTGRDVGDQINQAVADGVVDPQQGIAWRNATENLREAGEEGEADEDAVLTFQLEAHTPGVSFSRLRSALSAAYNEGRLGYGRSATRAYVALMGTVNNGVEAQQREAEAELKEARRETAAAAERRVDSPFAKSAKGYLAGQLAPSPQGGRVNREAARRWTMVAVEYDSRVRAGEHAMKVADDLIAKHGKALTPFVGGGGSGGNPARFAGGAWAESVANGGAARVIFDPVHGVRPMSEGLTRFYYDPERGLVPMLNGPKERDADGRLSWSAETEHRWLDVTGFPHNHAARRLAESPANLFTGRAFEDPAKLVRPDLGTVVQTAEN